METPIGKGAAKSGTDADIVWDCDSSMAGFPYKELTQMGRDSWIDVRDGVVSVLVILWWGGVAIWLSGGI